MTDPTPIRPNMNTEPTETDILKAQNLRMENLLTITRQQLSNVMFQMADRDLEIAQLRSQLPTA